MWKKAFDSRFSAVLTEPAVSPIEKPSKATENPGQQNRLVIHFITAGNIGYVAKLI